MTTFQSLNEIHLDAPGGVLPVLARTLSACDDNTLSPAHYVAVLAAVGFSLALWPVAKYGACHARWRGKQAGHVGR